MAMHRVNVVRVALVGVFVWSGWLAHGAAGSEQAGGQAEQRLSTVTKTQFDEWMTTLSNWGRWGKDDELGALNLITPAKRKQAAALVRNGTAVSLSREIRRDSVAVTAGTRPVRQGGGMVSRFLVDGDFLYERQEMEYHGGALSHFDALCHVSYQGNLYNGFRFAEVVTPDGGCAKLGVTVLRHGLITRGILLDMPGTRVRPADIEAWEKRTGVRIASGDALLLRTRRSGAPAAPLGSAGYDPSLIPFLKARDIALLGSDGVQEGGDIPGLMIPMHRFMLVALGVPLLDNLDLEALAETTARLKRWDFMLSVAPLRVERGAGSAVDPIAVF